jgi:hypothetical protein
LHSNAYFNNVASSSAAAMSFADYPAFLAPPIQGEFTSLLLQDDGHSMTHPTVRRLDFHERTSTTRPDIFHQGSHMF